VAKKATAEIVIGEQGVALIASLVAAMGHLWHPTSGADSGIDGQIELRDPATSEVRNVRIGVQSKATEKRWIGETDTGFYFRPRPRDVQFWLSSTQPVLLICSRPRTKEIYWRSVQEWARDASARSAGRVDFEKRRDRFDVDARDALFDLSASAEDRVAPPGAPAVPERLLTNLMPISWAADQLFSAAVPRLNLRLLVEPAPAARDGRIWSLREFRAELVDEARATDLKQGSLEGWRESDQPSDLNMVRELVRRDLMVQHRAWIEWHDWKRVAYFKRAQPDWEPVYYVWTTGSGRAVVAPQEAKTRDGYTSYRHDAAELDVRRLDGVWYVQIRPTYLFTWDGQQVSGHHDSALKAIKKLDRHSTVSQMLRMWQHLFVERLTLGADGEEAPFSLGSLVDCDAPRSIVDKTWLRIAASDADADADEDAQQSIFDFGETLT